MRKISMKKKTAATLTAGAICLGTAAGAYAYWTTTGSGTGSATTGSTTPWTVTSATNASAANALSPSGPTQTVSITVTNAGSGNQKINQVIASVSGFTGAGTDSTTPACAATDYKLGTSAVGAPSTVIFGEDLAPGASATHTVTIQMIDNNNNQDNCKNATVNLALAAS